jgi:hypothetical protein
MNPNVRSVHYFTINLIIGENALSLMDSTSDLYSSSNQKMMVDFQPPSTQKTD